MFVKGKHHTKKAKRKMSKAQNSGHFKKGCTSWSKGLTKETDERVKRMSESFKGARNPSWIDGTGYEPYSPEFTKELKELIRIRDGYQCQLCGMSEMENNKKLTTHHIDYDKKNCLPLNLISLCIGCNGKVNFNRSKWTKYFDKKIERIMSQNTIQLNFRQRSLRKLKEESDENKS